MSDVGETLDELHTSTSCNAVYMPKEVYDTHMEVRAEARRLGGPTLKDLTPEDSARLVAKLREADAKIIQCEKGVHEGRTHEAAGFKWRTPKEDV